ncbi:MAG: hypothetical protein KatS3mg111_2636 [Pirellulaceae bacterium]|nr:MAG: hypothetical protein KatS3mg111_2636 [Pirellulaceae bacterium]
MLAFGAARQSDGNRRRQDVQRQSAPTHAAHSSGDETTDAGLSHTATRPEHANFHQPSSICPSVRPEQ